MDLEHINIPEIVEKFSHKKIMVVGDVMLDTYLWGRVNRISPEAPVPVVSCSKRENRLGGAANVAWNIHTLGAEVILCSVVGDDEKGRALNGVMDEIGISKEGMLFQENRQTTSKTRVIGQNQQLLRVDQEQIDYLTGKQEQEFIAHILQLLGKNNIDAIIFQDYDKGAITPDLIARITSEACKREIPVLVDPKRRNYSLYENVSVFKPNFKEFIEGLKLEIAKDDYDAIFEVAKKFLSEKNIEYLLLTLSELGIFVCDSNNYTRVPTIAKDVADVSGAGDTVVSVAALCRASGLDIEQTAKLANLAGGLVCSKVGVVPVQKQWLIDY